MRSTRSQRRSALLASVATVALLVTGCAGMAPKRTPSRDMAGTPTSPATAAPTPTGGTATSPPTAMDPVRSETKVAPETTVAPPHPQQVGEPRAGMADDNRDFAAYLKYIGAYKGPNVHLVDVSGRRFIQVVDGADRPVVDAKIAVTSVQSGQAAGQPFHQGRTYADGRAPIYPTGELTQFRVTVERGSIKKEAEISIATGETAKIVLDQLQTAQEPVRLDVLFLLDATGSMGDEIDQLKLSIDKIAARIDGLDQPTPLTRYGMVLYRDRGDDYVTRTFDFTSDVKGFAKALNQVEAANGGDTPESVNEGLHKAINGVDWRMDAPTIRLVFLVADAPPHLDYQQDYDYAKLMPEATGKGIKLFSIAASGLDDQGEYVFRQLAQYTQGRFVFLTYADGVSGAPGDKTSHHVEQFQVEKLDDLVVKLVADEVRQQAPQE